jgi:hypothetical protein
MVMETEYSSANSTFFFAKDQPVQLDAIKCIEIPWNTPALGKGGCMSKRGMSKV